MTFGRRHPDQRGWVWGVGLAMATTVAALRVASGKHFVTDVLVGAAVGALIGWAVPTLNMKSSRSPSKTSQRGMVGAGWSGTF